MHIENKYFGLFEIYLTVLAFIEFRKLFDVVGVKMKSSMLNLHTFISSLKAEIRKSEKLDLKLFKF